ncbi:MAG TPA: helix-turn-helix transcriptional regulator [Eubacteriales bacterium]|nr:helix-turn-helix transcriptional regulator [Eubacteriales bacterium]
MKYLYISRIGRSWYAYAGDEMKGYVFPIGADIDKRAAIARWDAAGIQTVSRASPTESSAESRAKNAQEKTGLSYKGVWGDSSIPPDAALPNYARVLRESRLKVNLTQRRVAELCGVTEKQYQNWELGRSPIPQKRLIAVATALRINVAKLLQP